MTTNTPPGTFAYPGSKTSIAGWILEHVPEHTQYIEAFGGAASVLVAKERSDIEVYNDLNSDCVTFFNAVKSRCDELSEWIANTPTSRELFNQFVESYPAWPEDTVEHAGRFLYVQVHAFGGKGVASGGGGTYRIVTSNAYRSRLDAAEQQWADKREKIYALRDRLQRVNIERLDYAELVDRFDGTGAFFYFDPPYVDVGDDYYQTEDGGFDHSRFVETVQPMDAKWLISYGPDVPPGLREYHTVTRGKRSTMDYEKTEKTEMLVMNYDPSGVPLFTDAAQTSYGEFV